MFNILQEVKKHVCYDDREENCKKQIIDFLNIGNNSFSRTNLEGHITAGGFVCDGLGNILLNHHVASGMWFQFGGHSDGNSNSLEVALREISEEAGITDIKLFSDGIFDLDVQKIPYSARKNEPEHFHYDINFLFLVKDKSFEISDESMEIKWVTINEARKLVDKLDYAMHRMINKYEELVNNNFFCN